MEIPDWFLWIALGMIAFQILALVRVIGLVRAPDPTSRSKARMDLPETVGVLLLPVGLLLNQVAAEAWALLGFAGFVLTTAGYAWKGVHRLRARRHPTT